MSKPKYKQGKQICSMADFEKSECLYFKVKFGNKVQTKHRSFLISWQYRTLLNFIQNGWVFEAERVKDAKLQTDLCEKSRKRKADKGDMP